MDKELKQWKERVAKRKAEAAKEKALKEQIFAELRQEFGYDVNPNDPQFKDKIEEKEKSLAKRLKEEKKARRLAAKAEAEMKAKSVESSSEDTEKSSTSSSA